MSKLTSYIIVFSYTTNIIYCFFETMTSILGIPLIILNIHGDGVNSSNDLTFKCTTFVYTLCGMECGLTKNGFALFTLENL